MERVQAQCITPCPRRSGFFFVQQTDEGERGSCSQAMRAVSVLFAALSGIAAFDGPVLREMSSTRARLGASIARHMPTI